MIDAPAEIEKKGNMRISSTHGSRLSSLELQSDRGQCGAVKSSFLAVRLPMRTIEIPKLLFSKWRRWNDRNQIEGGQYPGIYLIAITSRDDLADTTPNFGDISYIGMSNSREGLRGRWNQLSGTIEGKRSLHRPASRMFADLGAYPQWTDFLYVAGMIVTCNTNRPTCDDYIRMGWVALLEYEAIACYFRKFDRLPEYNQKRKRPDATPETDPDHNI